MQSNKKGALAKLPVAGCKLQVLSKHLLSLGSVRQGHNQAASRLVEGFRMEQKTGGVCGTMSACLCMCVCVRARWCVAGIYHTVVAVGALQSKPKSML